MVKRPIPWNARPVWCEKCGGARQPPERCPDGACRTGRSAPSADVAAVSEPLACWPPRQVFEAVDALLATGLHGHNRSDVVERLLCERLLQIEQGRRR